MGEGVLLQKTQPCFKANTMNKRDEAVREEVIRLFAKEGRVFPKSKKEMDMTDGNAYLDDGLKVKYIVNYVLQKLQEERERVISEVKQALPEEIGESEGWDLAFENCCGGDDTAHGWNHCREVVLKKLSIIKSK